MPDFIIGVIANTHGIKGELKIFPVTDDPARFELLSFVNINGKRFDIEKVRFQRKLVMLKLSGIDDMTAAEKLKGKELTIPEELGLPLAQDEYYVRDLYGLNVVTEGEVALGTLSDVLKTGANDVYVISAEGRSDILIPAIKQFVLNVDLSAKTVTVKLPEGL